MDEKIAKKMTIDEAVATLIGELPEPVREFVLSSKRDEVALTLIRRYSLHVDQGATFQQAYLHMLLGIKTPDEFAADLKNAWVPQEIVSKLSADVNEMVFVPLRRAERNPVQKPVAPLPA